MNSSVLPKDCWELVGPDPGPRVVVIGGTHGDELVGVDVVRKYLRVFALEGKPPGTYPKTCIRGRLFLVFGNPEAIRLRQRSASGQRDLNRYFLREDLERPPQKEDPYDLVRARELAPILAQAEFVIDLHGTSSDSPPFVCFGKDSIAHRRLYGLLPVRYVLTDPKNILAQDQGQSTRGTTDSYVEEHGGIALGYETGKEDDMSRSAEVMDSVTRLLHEIGTLFPECPVDELRLKPGRVPQMQKVYALAHSIQARASGFSYASGMNQGWQRVAEGQLIGTYVDGEEERSPADGMLVFPKAVAKVEAGKNLYYIAKGI